MSQGKDHILPICPMASEAQVVAANGARDWRLGATACCLATKAVSRAIVADAVPWYHRMLLDRLVVAASRSWQWKQLRPTGRYPRCHACGGRLVGVGTRCTLIDVTVVLLFDEARNGWLSPES